MKILPGNIQGGGRKFMWHFERHFMSQIPPGSFKQGYNSNIKLYTYFVANFGFIQKYKV